MVLVVKNKKKNKNQRKKAKKIKSQKIKKVIDLVWKKDVNSVGKSERCKLMRTVKPTL